MNTYKDKVLFEAVGHDHLMDIRYEMANSNDINSTNYLNKIIFPSISPNVYTNPGFSSFLYDTSKKEASNLKCTFLKLAETFDISDSTSLKDLPFFEVDF